MKIKSAIREMLERKGVKVVQAKVYDINLEELKKLRPGFDTTADRINSIITSIKFYEKLR